MIAVALAGASATVELAPPATDEVAEQGEARQAEPVASSLGDEDDAMAAVEAGDVEPEPLGGDGDPALPTLRAVPAPSRGVAVVLALERDRDVRVADDHVLGWASRISDGSFPARGPPTAC